MYTDILILTAVALAFLVRLALIEGTLAMSELFLATAAQNHSDCCHWKKVLDLCCSWLAMLDFKSFSRVSQTVWSGLWRAIQRLTRSFIVRQARNDKTAVTKARRKPDSPARNL